MAKENFKQFVRLHPELIGYTKNGEMSWQKFYELYDMYGENHEIWNQYLSSNTKSAGSSQSLDASFKELMNMIKKVDMETVQKGVNGLQRALGIIQDLGVGTSKATSTPSYEPRPTYKYFED